MDEFVIWLCGLVLLFVFLFDYMTLKATVKKLQSEIGKGPKPDRMIHYYDRSRN